MRFHPYVAALAMSTLAACSQQSGGSKPVGQTNEELQKSAQEYNAQQKDAGDKVVCEYQAITGTHFKQKVCRTVSQIEHDEEEAERMMWSLKTETSKPPGK